MAVGPRTRVEAPQAAPGRRGLLAAAVEITEPDLRWVNGFAYEAESCDSAQSLPLYCEPGLVEVGYEKDPGASGGVVEFDPFLVIGSDTCTTLDRNRDREGRARRQLLATESEQIEAEFWDGTIAAAEGYDNPYFAEDGVATDPGSAGVVTALAELEQALAECLHGKRRMIHATPFTVSLWAADGLLRVEGGLLLTALDTIVVAGAGYSGSAPGDPPSPPADISAGAHACGTGVMYSAAARSSLSTTATWSSRMEERPGAAGAGPGMGTPCLDSLTRDRRALEHSRPGPAGTGPAVRSG